MEYLEDKGKGTFFMELRIENPILNQVGITDEEARQIGLKLQQKREQNSKKSLADIAKKLKISEHYLENIEKGDWALLPQGSNGRGFVRLYAKELEVALPEFDKFLNVENIIAAPQAQSNLSRIIEYARSKRHMNDYKRHTKNVNAVAKKPVQTPAQSETTILVPVSTDQSVELPQTNSINMTDVVTNPDYKNHKKKWFLYGSLAIGVLGTGLTTYIVKQSFNNEIDPEIAAQPMLQEPIENSNTSMLQTDAPNTTIDAESSVKTNDSVNNPAATVQLTQSSTPVVPVETSKKTEISTDKATQTPAERVISTSSLQKMQIDILSPVELRIETDGKQVLQGLTQPGTLSFEFEKNALLVVQDSSKVKLTYAGWDHELLGAGTRKRTIMLNAKQFAANNQ